METQLSVIKHADNFYDIVKPDGVVARVNVFRNGVRGTDEEADKYARLFAASPLLLAFAECYEAIMKWDPETEFRDEQVIDVLERHGFDGGRDAHWRLWQKFVNNLGRQALTQARAGGSGL